MDQQTQDAIDAGAIIKCAPWGKDQGAFVLVNASDFDPAVHVRFDAPAKPVTRAKKAVS